MPYKQKLLIKPFAEDTFLRKEQQITIPFSAKALDQNASHCLFFTCENRSYAGTKTEPLGDKLYMLIDDCLSAEESERDRYALDMSCEKECDYLRLAAFKIPWGASRFGHAVHFQGVLPWEFGIRAKAEKLSVAADGFLRLRLDLWRKKEGVDAFYTGEEPDQTYCIDIAEGTYDYKDFSALLSISDEETAAVLVTVEGCKYTGTVYLEEPVLRTTTNRNLLPPFENAISGLSEYAWVGLNLSKKEWPKFRMSLNGKVFFEDEVFLHVHRYTPIDIPIPEGFMVPGGNELTIQYISDYHDTVPVSIGEIAVLERPLETFRVLYCPDFCRAGKALCLLAETTEDDVMVSLESADFIEENAPLHFAQKGLHVIRLRPLKEENNLCFSLSYADRKEIFTVPRFVHSGEDHVVCGTGDFVYTNVSDLEAVKRFLIWYITKEAGNLLTIRPVYRWGGQRTVNPEVWKLVTRIMNDMDFSYVHMSDGRDLPGMAQNPSHAMLEGKGFLGCQVHERDGQILYWGGMPREVNPTAETFGDIHLRLSRENPETMEKSMRSFNIAANNGHLVFRKDPIPKADMKAAHDTVLKQLRDLAEDGSSRHTGPVALFKAFYEAGFSWAGAETMYGALEPLLAFLRGAAKAYGKTDFGVHHAVQWSTHPHNSPKKYRRYLLALLLSYMHGVTDINTEEGLWFLESQFYHHHRDTEVCQSYQEMERRLHRYIVTHERKGKFVTRTAFLHGRYDGWAGMFSPNFWGDPNMPCGEAGASWQLLKVFYPMCRITERGMNRAGYIPEETDSPVGFYSGTPHGNVDAIPIENGDFTEYSLLCFAGYNAAETADFDRLLDFVEQGGTLIAGWPHLSTTTGYEDICKQRHRILKHPLTEKLSAGEPVFKKDTYNGKEVEICSNLPADFRVLETTDSGEALVYQVEIGTGTVVLINALYYPGNPIMLPVYERILRKFQAEAEEEAHCKILCKEDVGYTAYAEEDGTVFFYLTAVDWYQEPERKREATLCMGEHRYPLTLTFGEIRKVIVGKKNTGEGIAAWTLDMETDLLSLRDGILRVQGCGEARVCIAGAGEVKEHRVVFGNTPVVEIQV